jgi:hypothetical protein
MPILPNNLPPPIRPAVCMVCLWTWATPLPDEELAHCPNCNEMGGVPAVIMRNAPNWDDFVIVGPPEELRVWTEDYNRNHKHELN